MLPIVLSGAVGAILAVLSDLIQKNEASATLKIAHTIETTVGIHFPPIVSVLLVLSLAISLCIISEAETKTKAFYIGASILAIMMTLVPYRLPPSLPTSPQQPALGIKLQGGTWHDVIRPTPALHHTLETNYHVRRVDTSDVLDLPVEIILVPDDKSQYSVATVKILYLDRTIVGQVTGDAKRINSFLNAGEYIVRVESPGYAILEKIITVEPFGVRSENVFTLKLGSTNVPLTVQRLFK